MDNEVRYNPNPPKTIEVADSNTDYTSGDWIGGVDDTNGYVIVTDSTSANLVGSGTGGGVGSPIGANIPVFWVSTGKTDVALIDLANRLPGSPGNFMEISAVLNWINPSSYTIINYGGESSNVLGTYTLRAQYAPAQSNGWITFPNHQIGNYDLDPNHVGSSDGQTYNTQIYINVLSNESNDNTNAFNAFVNKSGTLTLNQNGNVVIYSFTNQAFEFGFVYGATQLYADNQFENSVLGSITLLQPATSPFNITDPITISYTIN